MEDARVLYDALYDKEERVPVRFALSACPCAHDSEQQIYGESEEDEDDEGEADEGVDGDGEGAELDVARGGRRGG